MRSSDAARSRDIHVEKLRRAFRSGISARRRAPRTRAAGAASATRARAADAQAGRLAVALAEVGRQDRDVSSPRRQVDLRPVDDGEAHPLEVVVLLDAYDVHVQRRTSSGPALTLTTWS
ncbi:hypothetical protein [Sorangium cellulosum]|nr:hypothetical protein [Sorangium cellulosum]